MSELPISVFLIEYINPLNVVLKGMHIAWLGVVDVHHLGMA